MGRPRSRSPGNGSRRRSASAAASSSAPSNPATGEYRACVEAREGDDPTALGLESGRLPGGRYLRTRLRGEPPQVYERIAPTFGALVKTTRPDETRPSIEFYRRRDEIDLLLPVATT
jgi:DNA gyrase inhibitor GyrI